MLAIYKEMELEIPEGVTIEVNARIITVKGPRGELKKDLRHISLDLRLVKGPKGDKIKFIVWHAGRRHAACLRTAQAIVNNMIKGVTLGYQYKMRAVYNHFPINLILAPDGKSLEIRNFLGEKRVRHVKMAEGVVIKDDKSQKDQVLVEGVRTFFANQNDLERVSQSAASLHDVTLVRNKDIRKFLDGIYCTDKTSIEKVDA